LNVLQYLHDCGIMVQLDMIHVAFCGCSMQLGAIGSNCFELLKVHRIDKDQIGSPSSINLVGKGYVKDVDNV